LRLLWTQPLVNFHGRWHHIPDAGINPLPIQRPIPIWFGGTDDRVLNRMAHIGDGWMLIIRTLEQARLKLDRLYQYLEEADRDKALFGIDLCLNMNIVGPDRWTRFIDDCKALGATQLTVNTMGCGYETPSAHLEALTNFAKMAGLS
jgi:alkanesulfonate monooxygenase SsuD/methylene tetrahydromethanopterin reductase-like flavin-dependent oxidoreductase (luciferase family)